MTRAAHDTIRDLTGSGDGTGSTSDRLPTTVGHVKLSSVPQTGKHLRPIAPAPGAPGSASHAKPGAPTPGAPGSASHAKPGGRLITAPSSATHKKPVPATASHAKPVHSTVPATAGHTKPVRSNVPATASHTKPAHSTVPATAKHQKPVPATAKHQKPARPSTVTAAPARGEVSMRTFGATVLLMVVALAVVAALGRQLETVEPVEEPPAWSYDRDAATVAAPIQAAPAPEPVVRERTRVPVAVQAGAIVIGADDVLTEEVEATLTIPTERFDTFIQDLHRDDERQDYWLDLVDGRRIEVDAVTAKALFEARPYRMSYEREADSEQGPIEGQ